MARLPKSNKEFLIQVLDSNPNIEALDEYKNSLSKIRVKCRICNHEWYTTPNYILHGCKCPSCNNLKRNSKKTNDEFNNELYKLYNGNIVSLGSYVNNRTNIRFKSKTCNHEWEQTPTKILKGNGCKICNIERRVKNSVKSHDKFVEEVSLINKNVKILSKYERNYLKVKCLCLIDGNIFYMAPGNLLNGQNCPLCNKSKGEIVLENVLSKNNLEHMCYKTFDNLVGVRGKNLSYDFYLPKYNLLIEYQGEFHDGTAKLQTEEEFKRQQEHDIRKREYAINNNINLLEIWYWDFDNIEKIISNKFHLRRNGNE